jgi:broad specificity phosphatase PhoE
MSTIYFLAHPEVVIDPQVPVPQWTLSDVGRSRMESFCERAAWLSELTRLVSSAETKAVDGAKIVQNRYGLPLHKDSQYNELDRSATGYLSKVEHGVVSKAAFANPQISVRGWETTADAQQRVVGAVISLAQTYPTDTILISSHGGVGTLLLCRLLGDSISTKHAMQNPGGGCYFSFDSQTQTPRSHWIDIDAAT